MNRRSFLAGAALAPAAIAAPAIAESVGADPVAKNTASPAWPKEDCLYPMFDMEAFDQCPVSDLASELFIGRRCWIGVSSPSAISPAAVSVLFEYSGGQVWLFHTTYRPDDRTSLLGGKRIVEDLLAFCDVYDVQGIAIDPHQHHVVEVYADGKDLPIVHYPYTSKMISAPAEGMVSLVKAKRLVHGSGQDIRQHFAGAMTTLAPRGTNMPEKRDWHSRGIDIVIAACMANGLRMMMIHEGRVS